LIVSFNLLWTPGQDIGSRYTIRRPLASKQVPALRACRRHGLQTNALAHLDEGATPGFQYPTSHMHAHIGTIMPCCNKHLALLVPVLMPDNGRHEAE
jgi:hypothetical protein